MDYFDMLTEQRIDSETADLVDALLEQALPSLQPCDCPLETVLRQLADKYSLTVLPRESTHYAQTALASSRIFRKTRIIFRTIGKIGWNRRSV